MARRWNSKSNVSKIWKELDPDTVTKEELNEAVVAIAMVLYTDAWFNGMKDGELGAGLFASCDTLREVIDEVEFPGGELCMDYVEDVAGFDYLLSEIYDYADEVRIWIEPV